jgi:hypothetical protein
MAESKNTADAREVEMAALFLSGPRLRPALAAICLLESARADPVTHTILSCMHAPVQGQLTKIGLQPFQAKARFQTRF